ncbi:MAG: O-methyltransferase, partial [Muribaculaceae bacterium]|nr:O-methyltransferase [Muribaculaceae bacterium]
MEEELQEYIENHISAEPPHLARLYRRTQLTRLYPRMCSGHIQGRMLKMLTQMISPARVLELGTFTGYSALCMAEGMKPGTELHTVEIDDEYADDLRELFAASPGGEKISLHIGDALELVRELPGPWDLVFIDANKRHYSEYYKALLPLVAPGGYIIA